MREHEPAILGKTHKWLLIEDFVNFMLCGETATDYSMASTTLLFDQRTRTWNDDFLQRSGIDCSLLCEPVLTPEVQRMGVVVDSHVARDRYAVMGATVAADMLEWFKHEIGSPSSSCGDEGASEWARLIDLASQSPIGSNGLFFLPHMSGSFCPVLDPTSTGAFVGLRNIAGRGDLFRAMIEGLNYQFLQIIRAFGQGLGVRSDKIVVIGGPTKNRLWMQNKADVTGIVVEVPDMEEAVPLGAAILAGIGTGVYRNEQDAFSHVYRPGTSHAPDPQAQARYRELYARHEDLYPTLKTFVEKLPG